ncbi:MAG: haloacid dehalogenase superfamily protein subfamily variant 3 with third motif having or [Candidatus Doudnabacteria bacterium]|nr:haloacid dehalogenase superfamily protein subfamily variant 3 with third motif having or [Candidatus Doudnabacteria bacterium]
MKTKEPTVIKYIIFDIGNVLIVDTEFVFEKVFHLNKLSDDARDEYKGMIHQTERGDKPVRELLKTIIRSFDLSLTETEVETFLTSSALIKPMWKLATSLTRDYPIAILTNNQKGWPEKMANNLKVSFNKFKMFNSAEIKLRKPGSEIYEYVTKKLKAKPEEIVFIDDRIYNLVEPKKIGWHTIRFTGNVPAVIKALKKLGVKVRI